MKVYIKILYFFVYLQFMKKVVAEVIIDEWQGKPTSEPIIDKDGYFSLLHSEPIQIGDWVELVLFADTQSEYLWPDYYKGPKSTSKSEVVKVIAIRRSSVSFNDAFNVERIVEDIESIPNDSTFSSVFMYSIKVVFRSEVREGKIDTVID